MATKRTGNPRGRRPGWKKSFLADPDRAIIAMARWLQKRQPKDDFAPLLEFAIYFHRRERINMPNDPLSNARRLRLDETVRTFMQHGYCWHQFGPDQPTNRGLESDVRRLERKNKRIETDPAIVAWLQNMSDGWTTIFTPMPSPPLLAGLGPNFAGVALGYVGLKRAVIYFKAAGELPYFTNKLLPALVCAFGDLSVD